MEDMPRVRKRKAPGEEDPLRYASKRLHREDEQWKARVLHQFLNI